MVIVLHHNYSETETDCTLVCILNDMLLHSFLLF